MYVVYVLEVVFEDSECVGGFVVEVVVLIFEVNEENRSVEFVEEFYIYVCLCVGFFDVFCVCYDCVCVLVVLYCW